eukprot:CAMPEP_0182901156 /NCGR_PEP_ID=MMETSP0034_2-20130328/29413_1 /TAXON_ID=156128 /ORGANISM="Nephroselmis pyriformis, Strain CCMP717" /LENGTH=147 /DNA_ID=CAMNT_0025035497 /DNA_START=40 /DNA_END=481 /DNA_ORIENTATION=-
MAEDVICLSPQPHLRRQGPKVRAEPSTEAFGLHARLLTLNRYGQLAALWLLADASDLRDEGFLVPREHFGEGVNHIGMERARWEVRARPTAPSGEIAPGPIHRERTGAPLLGQPLDSPFSLKIGGNPDENLERQTLAPRRGMAPLAN